MPSEEITRELLLGIKPCDTKPGPVYSTYLLLSFNKLLQRPMKSLCKAIKKLFKAKAHLPGPELAGRNMEIGVDILTSVEDISFEIEKRPMAKEKKTKV